jgi:transposase
MPSEVSIGVDISKLKLDVCNLLTGEILELENNPDGIKKFVRYAKKAKPSFIICESTGGLEQPFFLACSQAVFSVTY